MTRVRRIKVAVAGAVLMALAQAALGQATTLRYRTDAGQRRVYDRTVRTEMTAQSGEQSRRTVTEVPVQRRELVIETKADPPSMRLVIVDAPAGETILVYEENGKDRLSSVPETSRTRSLPPSLFSQWRDLRGVPLDKMEKPKEPGQAVDLLQAEMRFLPEQPVKPGDTWTRDVDLGVGKATLTSNYAASRPEGDVPCAIIETSVAVTFTGAYADRLKVEKMTSKLAWALDGSGWVSQSGSMVLVEKADKVEQRVTRDFREKLSEATKLDAAQLDKARKDLTTIEKAIRQAQADDLDGALEMLSGFLRDNPQGPWTAAVQTLYSNLQSQKLLTKPVPAPRLRLMLRDLQATRDQAGAQGNAAQLGQVDQTLRQVASVNLKTLLEDSQDPDPIVRDLAAFGLAFAKDEQAVNRLLALVKDDSAQVRGTVLISLTVQGKTLGQAALVAALKDPDVRVQGAAALLVSRTVKKGDPSTDALMPMLLENIKTTNAWARLNAVSAIVALSPPGATAGVRALIAAWKAEKEERLRPFYINAMKTITGVEGRDPGPYEDWLRKQPAEAAPAPAPAAPSPPAPAPEPKPVATPKG
jgi:HEAT repeat protein